MQQTAIAVPHQAGALAALGRILDRERMQFDLAVHDLRPHLDERPDTPAGFPAERSQEYQSVICFETPSDSSRTSKNPN